MQLRSGDRIVGSIRPTLTMDFSQTMLCQGFDMCPGMIAFAAGQVIGRIE